MKLSKVRNNEREVENDDSQGYIMKKKKPKGINEFEDDENMSSTRTVEVTGNENVEQKQQKKFKKSALKQVDNVIEENENVSNNLRSSSKNKKRKNINVEDPVVLQVQPTEVIESTNIESKVPPENISEAGTSTISKKKRKRNHHNECESEMKQNSHNTHVINPNPNIEKRLEVQNESVKPTEESSLKKKKRKRNRNDEHDSNEPNIDLNNHNDATLFPSPNADIAKRLETQTEIPVEPELSPSKKKKRKKNHDGDSGHKVSKIEQNNVTNLMESEAIHKPEIRNENQTITSIRVKPKKKKNANERAYAQIKPEIERNTSSNDQISSVVTSKKKKLPDSTASHELPAPGKSEANSVEKSNSKPLKSALKKKKRKKKKKSTDQTKISGNDNGPKVDWKKGKSVTFDENIQVELIDSCKDTPPDENAELANTRKKEKAIAYLQKWKDFRSKWKFEKLTQLWLLKNMYQENMIPSEVFDILLDYLVDLKGASRDLVIDLSEKIVAKMEQKTPEENDQELETAYNRARRVLQFLR